MSPPIEDDESLPMPCLFGNQGEWVGLTESEAMFLSEYNFEVYERVHRSCLDVEAAERRLREATAKLHKYVAAQRAVEAKLLAIPKVSRIDLVRQMIDDRFL